MPHRTTTGWVRLLGWALLALTLVAQVYGLYAPSVPGPVGIPGLDKIGHVVAFAVPTLLAGLLRARWLVVLLIGHALVAEPLQDWLAPGRVGELGDVLANLAGLALGAFLADRVARSRHDGGMPYVEERGSRG